MAEQELDGDALLEAVDRSRKHFRDRIARVLHDGICQSITAAGLSFDLAKMDMSREDAAKVSEGQKLLERAFEEVRWLSHETHPDPVTRFGPVQAVERLAEAARRRFRGELIVETGRLHDAQPERITAIVDILDAALDNAIRHSGATRIWMNVTSLKGEVRDDGKGFVPVPSTTGLGLVMMSYWARRAGMELRVSSAAARGTTVSVEII